MCVSAIRYSLFLFYYSVLCFSSYSLFTLLTLVEADLIYKPNIVFLVADDLGWDDVSFHGSDQILTPNIDTLAYHGCVLNQYYTDTDGTPSRSALFTGKYPMRLGTQGASIRAFEDRGIPAQERLLPDYLQELGYETYLIGKWGVGKSRAYHLPSNRGFSTFYGFLGHSVDYFTYDAIDKCNDTTFYGLDFFSNTEAVEYQSGHLTNVLTNRAVQVIRKHDSSVPLYLHVSHAAPHIGGALTDLQPPVDSIKENDHIAHPLRRAYAGLVTSLDKSIGQIVAALAEREMLHNTLIVFVSDNGAPTVGSSQNFGSNFPFSGVKSTPWEGAVRSVAIAWHANISSGIFDGLFHVTDWLPTLVGAADGDVKDKKDGINQWHNIRDYGERTYRKDLLISIDESRGWAAFREGDFKIIVGDVSRDVSRHFGKDLKLLKRKPPSYDNVLLECETFHVFKETLKIFLDMESVDIKRDDLNLSRLYQESNEDICVPTRAKGCLFNVSADPLETQDLWHTSPDVVRHLTLRLRSLWADLNLRTQSQCDLRADPSLRNYVWFPWINNDEIREEPFLTLPPFPLQVSIEEVKYLVDLNVNMFRKNIEKFLKGMGESIVKSVGGLFSLQ